MALESIDLSRRKTWLSPWDAKSSRQIGLTRLYCPHGTTQIIQPRRRLQIYGKVSCNWGNWKEEEEDREVEEAQNEENSGEKSLLCMSLHKDILSTFAVYWIKKSTNIRKLHKYNNILCWIEFILLCQCCKMCAARKLIKPENGVWHSFCVLIIVSF